MFWHKDTIKGLGWESIEDFVKDFVGEHSNCCIKYAPDGVYLDYDLDSNIIDKFNSTGCMSFRFTKEEWEKILGRSENA